MTSFNILCFVNFVFVNFCLKTSDKWNDQLRWAFIIIFLKCPKVYSTKGLKAKNMLKAKVEWLEVRLGLRVTKRLLDKNRVETLDDDGKSLKLIIIKSERHDNVIV